MSSLDAILRGDPAPADPAPAAPAPAAPAPAAPASGGQSEPAAPPAPPSKVTLELEGGVKQDVDPVQLAQLWASRSRIDALKAEADERLAKARGLEQLTQHLDALPDDQAAALLHAIRNPETLVSQRPQPARQPQQQGNDLEALLAEVQGDRSGGARQNQAVAELVDLVRRQAAELRDVSQYVRGEKTQRAREAVSQQVQNELQSYDVIRSVPGMAEFAQMTAMGLTAQGMSPSDAAAHVAAEAHKLAQKVRAVPPPRPRDPRAHEPTAFGHFDGVALDAPSKPFTADDLSSGRLSHELGRILAGE